MSTDAYLDAKARFEKVSEEVRALGIRLFSVGAAIRDKPSRFLFANAPGAFPAEAGQSRDSVSEDGATWPTAAKINEMLGSWHDAKQAMEDAWFKIPADRQAGLIAPPTIRTR